MSNALAIAAVTEALVNLLHKYLDLAHVLDATVTNWHPDRTDKVASPGINVFLYQVTPNTALRNADLPTRTADGTFLAKPQAAIDLHYLLTFYGDDTYLAQQRLLGAATIALHASPTIERSQITEVHVGLYEKLTSNLENQSQLVRFTPVVFSLEELSKLWSFLLKIDYVLSAAYVASVVLIEQEEVVTPPGPPVLSYNVRAQAIRQPVITSIVVVPNKAAPITASSTIALLGSNLSAPQGGATQVLINGATQAPSAITAGSITLTLPAGLPAGPQTAQVLQPVVIGTPATLHPGTGAASGLATFVLNPVVTGAVLLPAYGSPPGPAVSIDIVPPVQTGQTALLYLVPAGGAAPAQLLSAGQVLAETGTLIVAAAGIASGTYVVSVLIDGAQSLVVAGPGGTPPVLTI